MFKCERHGAIGQGKAEVVKWSETQRYVWCSGCGKWLGFTVTIGNG